MKRKISTLLVFLVVFVTMIGSVGTSYATQSSDVYYKIEDGVLHLGNTPYAGDNSGLINEEVQPWSNMNDSITSVVVDNDIYPTNTERWFSGLRNCTSMDLAKLHTENVTNMEWMFSNCRSLSVLDLSNFDFSSIEDMYGMFDYIKCPIKTPTVLTKEITLNRRMKTSSGDIVNIIPENDTVAFVSTVIVFKNINSDNNDTARIFHFTATKAFISDFSRVYEPIFHITTYHADGTIKEVIPDIELTTNRAGEYAYKFHQTPISLNNNEYVVLESDMISDSMSFMEVYERNIPETSELQSMNNEDRASDNRVLIPNIKAGETRNVVVRNVPKDSVGLNITKNIIAEEGVNTPVATYNFNIESVAVADGTTTENGVVNVYSGITEGLKQPSATLTHNEKTGYGYANFSTVTYPQAGIYRYKINETVGNIVGMTYDTTQYFIDVYVGYPETATTYTADDLKVLRVLSYNENNEKSDATFNNTYNTYPIKVEKKVSGNNGEYDRDFRFKINVSWEGGQEFGSRLYGSNGNILSENTCTVGTDEFFTLKHNQGIEFTGLPEGAEYTITELDSQGYTVSISKYKVENGQRVALSQTNETAITDTLANETIYVFTNDRTSILPLGVMMNILPFAVLVIAGCVILIVRRKNNE